MLDVYYEFFVIPMSDSREKISLSIKYSPDLRLK